MYNKSKRDVSEEVVYSRFVLSSVRVKTLHPSQEKTSKKKKKKKKKDTTEGTKDEDVEEEEELDSPEGADEKPVKTSKRTSKRREEDEKEQGKGEDEDESEEEIVVMEDGRKRIARKHATNKVGYQNKDGLYIIEGTKQLTDRGTVSDELKQDHFICICACLMLLTTPIQKWDTKKVDQVLDNGKHVFSHAEDLEISEKRTIKNVLIDKHFFDIIVKQQKIENWRDRKTLSMG